VFCIERIEKAAYNIAMPSSTDAGIEAIIGRIRSLCEGPFSPEAETELRKLARELRVAIEQHVKMARISLGTKAATIHKYDPGEDTR
jgi:hypothetical protein